MTSQRLITAFTALTPRRLRLGPRADAEFIGVLAIRHRTAAAGSRRLKSLGLAVGLLVGVMAGASPTNPTIDSVAGLRQRAGTGIRLSSDTQFGA
jgi:hypothetical protein